MGLAAMIATTAVYGEASLKAEYAGRMSYEGKLQDWEKDAFSKRLATLRAGSHCKGCGAPLTLTNEGACEYCGLKP